MICFFLFLKPKEKLSRKCPYNLKNKIMKSIKKMTVSFFAFSLFFGMTSMAQNTENTVEVGGALMYPSKNIVENAVNSKDHTTLVVAVKAAGLVEVLMSEGPFTVFAPTNAAFEKLPAGTVETLLKPENLKTLQTILTYHVVAGKMNKNDILMAIKKGNGKAMMTTVSGGTLTAWMKGKDLYIKDENGNSSMITITDVNQKNGVIHVVDTVVLPKS